MVGSSRFVALAASMLVIVGVLAGAPAAAADTGQPRTLYVQDVDWCSDTGPGTQGVPLCSVQAAADVVVPGQTVDIVGPPRHGGRVTLTRSGTSSAPITFQGVSSDPIGTSAALILPPLLGGTITLSGVHDVHVSYLQLDHTTTDAVDVRGSQDVVLDRLFIAQQGPQDGTEATDGVSVDGASSDVTVSRSQIYDSHGNAVQVASGAHDVTVTTNELEGSRYAEIAVSGTATADLTGNTLDDACGPGLTIDGGSSATVENNVFTGAGHGTVCPAPTAPVFSAAADSAASVTADYNAFAPGNGRTEYSWGGIGYTTAAAFTAATGQGAHDLDHVGYAYPDATDENSPVIDSADADAPGELATDVNGTPRVDDPLVADTGTGAHTTYDRGAFERQDTLSALGGATPSSGIGPLSVSVTPGSAKPGSWGLPQTYTVDFGDGSPAVTDASGTVTHTYTTPGVYAEKVTVTDANGSSATRTAKVTVGTATPPATSLTVSPEIAQGTVDAGTASLTLDHSDNWELASRTISWGDASSSSVPVTAGATGHDYEPFSSYTLTLTQTDIFGRTATATATFRPADSYTPLTPPEYDYQGTVKAHGLLDLTSSTLHTDSNGVDAAALRVTVTGGTAGGYLTLDPYGTTRPSVSALNFAAHQTTENGMTVRTSPSGDVYLFNGSAASISVKVVTAGIFSHAQYGHTYTPVTPVRVLDTRSGTGGVTGPVTSGKSITVSVAGTHGIPADAAAVVLDVQTTSAQASGSLSVTSHGMADSAVTTSYWAKGQTVSNLTVVPLADGKVVLHNSSSGSVQMVTDVFGYADATGTGSVYLPSTPTRILDTRNGTGTGGRIARLGAHQTLKLRFSGVHGIPSSGTTAADLVLTAVSPATGGYLTAWADGTTRPGTASLDYGTGRTTPNEITPPVGSDGYVDIYNGGSAAVNVLADQYGAYVAQ
ncbi:right-handed parallel beta-helix repeat-containing protein [Streptomyces sp. NPDC007162]|uniref:PKD domain-containing protein n=1 Tax=Streptomyces sp. NPDC007162 TaxID=3156917 RepID=UPI0033F96A5E